jgi:peroxiredoxin Q/BCP
MSEIAEGEKAPEFSLPASTGGEISLSQFKGKSHVVLYFYPKDMTPGCTKEACDFRDVKGQFEKVGAVILGVSTDDLKSHGKFTARHSLNFPLLSDADKNVTSEYGVYKEKSLYGRLGMGTERTTFVIDKEGVVRKVYHKVKVEKHAEAVLEFVRSLG